MSSTDSPDTFVSDKASIDLACKPETNEQPPSNALPRRLIVRYDEYFNQRTFSHDLRKTKKPVDAKKVDKKRPLLVVRRIIDSRGQHTGTKIDIKSDALCEVLIHINKEVKGLRLTKSRPVADMKLLFHSRAGLLDRLLEERAKESPDTNLIEAIETVLQFIHDDHCDTITDFGHLTSRNQITYELLWALFAPNTLVYRYHDLTEQSQVLVCRGITYKNSQAGEYAELSCDVITNDGSAFGLAREYLQIIFFSGTSKIQDLPVYPLDYHKDKTDIYQNSIRRGKKFAGITGQLFETSGPACREETDFDKTNVYKANTHGRVMIDPAVFRLFEPNNTINLPVYSTLQERDNLKDEEYLICTPVVLGFCFGTKMWGGFPLDRLLDITWSDEAFQKLVLGEKQKQLVYALVRQHSTHSRPFDDIVVGKGEGLIGLLCGNPGCGKTLTAEAVAEVTHRPLYVISAGELGTDPDDMDQNLARILKLAHIWKAVLLLDEAEVFLHKRSMADLARNALVSIFLRQLEYYQGILIMTTNMIGQCDPAFESRIHFCIRYPDLDFDSRKAVWKTFFSKALRNPGDISEEDINRLCKHPMNGRQIKNAVSSARSIALEQGSGLLVEHIDTVLEVLNDWHIAKDATL